MGDVAAIDARAAGPDVAVQWAIRAAPVIWEREHAPRSLRRLAERVLEAQTPADLLAASRALVCETERLTDALMAAVGEPGESSVGLVADETGAVNVRRPEPFYGTRRMSPQRERLLMRSIATRLSLLRLRSRPRGTSRATQREHRPRRNGARAPPDDPDPEPAHPLAGRAAA